MRVLPKKSPGVLVAPMSDRVIVYDLLTETAHHLNGSAGTLLQMCDGETRFDSMVDEWIAASGADPRQVVTDMDAGIAMFEQLGIVGRTDGWTPPKPPTGSVTEVDPPPFWSATHRVIDHCLTFRSHDKHLLDEVDKRLGAGHMGLNPTLLLDIDRNAAGEFTLRSEGERTYASIEDFLAHLVGVINEYAVWTHGCAALHAGALRSPGGRVVVLPAPSGSGKSTLTAALVQAGWDYLGDEAIGVRYGTLNAVGYPKRLALDHASRAVLGLCESDDEETPPEDLRSDVIRLDGDIGPIDLIVTPIFVAGSTRELEMLDRDKAITEIMANTLNLARSGEVGLAAICDLAERVPTHRLIHGDVREAVSAIEGLVR